MSELDNRIREYLALKERIQELEEENERLKKENTELKEKISILGESWVWEW